MIFLEIKQSETGDPKIKIYMTIHPKSSVFLCEALLRILLKDIIEERMKSPPQPAAFTFYHTVLLFFFQFFQFCCRELQAFCCIYRII